MSKSKKSNINSGFTSVFMSKLKEQSFLIILMLGLLYYQNNLMKERVSFWQNQFEKQQAEIESTSKDDKQILIDRIKYLQDQRDKYVEESLNDLKNK